MPVTPVCYLDKGYDQLLPHRNILEWASRYYVQGFRKFWVVLPEYHLTVTEDYLRNLEADLEEYPSYVFQTEKVFNSNVRTTLGEHHAHHGGLYLFNTLDYLNRLTGVALGIACYTRPEICTVRSTQVPIYVSATQEEANDKNLVRIRQARDSMFKAAGLKIHTCLVKESSIKAQHEYLFSSLRRDLCVVDADFLPDSSEVLDELRFIPDVSNNTYSHVWFCRNPVNGLVYGHGAPKVFPRVAQIMRRPSTLQTDFFLSVGTGVVVHPVCLGTHVFNWSAKSSFYAAAKECAKLALAAPTDKEAASRLDVWTSQNDLSKDQPYSHLCLEGALVGKAEPEKVLSDRNYLAGKFLNTGAANG